MRVNPLLFSILFLLSISLSFGFTSYAVPIKEGSQGFLDISNAAFSRDFSQDLEVFAEDIILDQLSLGGQEYIRSLADEEKEFLYERLREKLSPEEFFEIFPRIMTLFGDLEEINTATAASCGAYQVATYLESSYGGSTYYYASGVYVDNYTICGPKSEFPKDWIVVFPVGKNTFQDPSKIRIWSKDWTAQCATDGCVQARLYDNCIYACIGYWDAYFCLANPWSLKKMYVFGSSSIPDCKP